jgi:hypothetical protein
VAAITGTSVLVASAASLSGAGVLGHTGNASLVAGLATLAGVGHLNNFAELYADPATIVAFGVRTAASLGYLVADPAVLTASGTVDTPDSGRLIADPATMVATGVIGHAGVADLEAGPAVIVAAGTGYAVLSGDINVTFALTGEIPATITATIPVTLEVTGSLRFLTVLSGDIPATFSLTGSGIFQVGPSGGLEAEYEATGVRKSNATLVYVLDAKILAHIADVPFERSFLVASYFVPAVSDPFTEAGAGPAYIGTKYKDALGVEYVTFRKPLLWEVVWYVPENVLYRYELNRDTGTLGWNKYLSLPQRSLNGQYVFSLFDPDKVYDYYAVMWGSLMWRWSYDTDVLGQQLDPDKCASVYLPVLAAQWGYNLPSDEQLIVRRSLTRNAVPFFKFKGLAEAVRLRLQSLGLKGYVNEIWVNPDNVNNPSYLPLVPLNKAGEPSATALGAGVDYIERPHGYDSVEPTTHWPSSRLSLHINYADGAPIDFDTDAVPLQRAIKTLRQDVLPAHVDIRTIATDHTILAGSEVEELEVTDELDIFDVHSLGTGSLVASSATLAASGTVV